MSVRFVRATSHWVDNFRGGMNTDEIADVLEFFEDSSDYRSVQRDALETTLLYFWAQFQRLGDVTISLDEKLIMCYTSNTTAETADGWFVLRINFRGDVYCTVSAGKLWSEWGTNVYTPVRELKWDRFVHEVQSRVRPCVLGYRI